MGMNTPIPLVGVLDPVPTKTESPTLRAAREEMEHAEVTYRNALHSRGDGASFDDIDGLFDEYMKRTEAFIEAYLYDRLKSFEGEPLTQRTVYAMRSALGMALNDLRAYGSAAVERLVRDVAPGEFLITYDAGTHRLHVTRLDPKSAIEGLVTR